MILDPIGASFHTNGVDPSISQAVKLLQQDGILKMVDPATVLQAYEGSMAEAIRAELADPAFLQLFLGHAQGHGPTALDPVSRQGVTGSSDRSGPAPPAWRLRPFRRRGFSGDVEAAGANQADVIAFAETGQADNEIRLGSGPGRSGDGEPCPVRRAIAGRCHPHQRRPATGQAAARRDGQGDSPGTLDHRLRRRTRTPDHRRPDGRAESIGLHPQQLASEQPRSSGADWLLDWLDGRSGAKENGLRYLLRV